MTNQRSSWGFLEVHSSAQLMSCEVNCPKFFQSPLRHSQSLVLGRAEKFQCLTEEKKKQRKSFFHMLLSVTHCNPKALVYIDRKHQPAAWGVVVTRPSPVLDKDLKRTVSVAPQEFPYVRAQHPWKEAHACVLSGILCGYIHANHRQSPKSHHFKDTPELSVSLPAARLWKTNLLGK